MTTNRLAAQNVPALPIAAHAYGPMATSWCGSTIHSFAHTTKRRSRPTEPSPT